jgi:16S rRNA (cytidine1402-2'-O)-methyltransferase
MSTSLGHLYLVPTPLDFGMSQTHANLDARLPRDTVAAASRLQHWITENAKSTRAFLKRVNELSPLCAPLQDMQIQELPRQVHKKGDHTPDAHTDSTAKAMLSAALQGHSIGLVSEAGMPAIADPGSAVVRAAHALGIRVVPLVGPVSLMLALSASGLNGQHFAFVGYVPQEATERAQRLKALEGVAHKTGQTQILIETPYRNTALLQALLQHLQPHTRLAIGSDLGTPEQHIQSGTVQLWRQRPPAPPSGPAVFLFGV